MPPNSSCTKRRVGLSHYRWIGCPEKLILYPKLIYRHYMGVKLTDEVVLNFVRRCYYPDEFEKILLDHGFEFIGRWGGYRGEPYGEGTELVIQFKETS